MQLSDTSWLPGVCTSSDGVRVPEEDLAMLSIALKAIETGKKVFVRIETNRIIGGYCEAVQLSLRSN